MSSSTTPFSSRPPPPQAATDDPSSTPRSRSGRRKRVTVDLVAEDDGRQKMYYTHEDLNATPNLNVNPNNERPMGIKRAKRNRGKDGVALTVEVQEQLKSLVDLGGAHKEEITEMKEYQQQLSSQKLEAANLA
ncbi:hypothetical protein ABZP36_016477 [Zizania latifolia]